MESRVLRVMQEHRALGWQAARAGLIAKVVNIGGEMRMHPAPSCETGQQFGRAVILQIVVGAVAFVAAHDGGEGGQFAPAHHQLAAANIAEHRCITAAIRMAVDIAQQPRRERRRDHRADPVMAGEIDRLIPRPQQGTMTRHARKSCTHEEQRVPLPAPAGQRHIVHLGPQNRPEIMRLHRVAAVGKAHICRQIFAKIRHPARHADVEHLAPQHPFGEPRAGFLAGEVDHPAVELAEIDEIDRAIGAQAEVPLLGGFFVKNAIVGEVRVRIAEKAYPACGEAGDPLCQIGVALVAAPPIPEQPPAKTGFAHPGPVFTPQRADRSARRDKALKPLKAARSVLQPDDRPADRPIGQLARPAKPRRQLPNQFHRPFGGEEFETSNWRPYFNGVR